MTYTAEVQFKFDATWKPTYGTSSWANDEMLPEEHYLITAPAGDLNAKQYFKLFEKFLLCVGMCPKSIHSGAMSLVFNEFVNESDQRKVCDEYELTMNEDLQDKYNEFKKRDEEWARLKKGPMGTVLSDDESNDESNYKFNDDLSWETRYWGLFRRFRRFAKFTDEQLEEMVDRAEQESITCEELSNQ